MNRLIYLYKDKIRPFTRLQNYRNLWGWIKVVWDTHWWDFGYLIGIMEHQFKLMDENWDKSMYVGKEKDHKHIKEMRLLLERIHNQEYEAPEHLKESYGGANITPLPYAEKMIKQDLERFAQLFEKHIRSFWD